MIPASLAVKMAGWQLYLYKAIAVAVFLVGFGYFWWDRGMDDCKSDYAKENAAVVAGILEERLPVVQQAERDAARTEQELRTIKEKLDEAANRPIAADCSIDDDSLRLYREAAGKTKL